MNKNGFVFRTDCGGDDDELRVCLLETPIHAKAIINYVHY